MNPYPQEPTPEEKLLKLIKQGKQAQKKEAATPPPAVEPIKQEITKAEEPLTPTPITPVEQSPSSAIQTEAKPVPGPVIRRRPFRLHLPPIFARLHDWRRASVTWLWTYFGRLEPIPRVLLFACGALTIWILFHVVYDRVEAAMQIKKLWAAGSKAAAQDLAPAAAALPSDLSGGLPAKDIFKGIEEGPARGTAPARVASLDQIMANYTLGGILGGDQPQAIIEDKQQSKTYFLNVGDTLGEIKIIAITDEKVTVAVGDEQADLTL